ncbi:DUF1572 domain-containing protein [Chitinophaga caeni]|uniref:DUF1572 domain-containing protein n=1 Tax=Chitinophaga caeni TaxID=2029983 RepID=A0A291QYE2_9BACT|nr:DUF1572 domain-containing protein [Chitinophaga caeni]ATL48884.1 DUF1572 domain-containing protein [Chitinophaga caeni]
MLTKQLAKHFRDVHFGGNWTSVNLKDSLAGIDVAMATRKVNDLNAIAVLVFHIHYYIVAIKGVLEGKPLDAHDRYSFDLKPLESEGEWQSLIQKSLDDAGQLAHLIENLDEEMLHKDFVDPKYGNYLRNILGLTEHCHYHLGQIVIIKKLLNKA